MGARINVTAGRLPANVSSAAVEAVLRRILANCGGDE